MLLKIETYADRVVFIEPLTSDFYGTAGAVAQTASNELMSMALAYYLAKPVTEVQIFVGAERPEIEAAFAALIIGRFDAITWKPI